MQKTHKICRLLIRYRSDAAKFFLKESFLKGKVKNLRRPSEARSRIFLSLSVSKQKAAFSTQIWGTIFEVYINEYTYTYIEAVAAAPLTRVQIYFCRVAAVKNY